MPSDPGDELDRRFARTIADELARPGTFAPPADFPAFRLPPPLRASCVAAANLEGGLLPESLLTHYGLRMPRERIDQLHRAGDLRELLWEPLDPHAMPRLRTALDGLFRVLGPDAARALSSPDRETLLAERPTIAALHAHALFGSGLPFLGAHPAERELLRIDLGDGAPVLDALDRRLSGNLVHELCHGRPDAGPTPWFVLEAAATWLGARAYEPHVFPEETAVAIPGVALFVLLGDGLARLAGPAALTGLVVGSRLETALGTRLASLLSAAGWQDWLRRRTPPFVLDPRDALEWLKLADGSRASDPVLERAIETSPFSSAFSSVPDLVDHARRLAWPDLPWWNEPVTEADFALIPRAFAAMCLVDELAPTFQTNPSDPPDGALELDLETCLLRAKRRPEGIFAEPARWLVPPNVCRTLVERGARRVRFAGISRHNRAAAAETFAAFAHDRTPLPGTVDLAWTSSPEP